MYSELGLFIDGAWKKNGGKSDDVELAKSAAYYAAAAADDGDLRGRSDGVRVGAALRGGRGHVPGRGAVEAATTDR